MTSAGTTQMASQPAGQSQQTAQADIKAAEAPGAPMLRSSLYIGDLAPNVTETILFDLFCRMGAVHSIRVCRDQVTRKSLGYAYVNYNANSDPDAAEKALEELNYYELEGRKIRIMWTNRDPSTRRSGLGNIFIKNLDRTIDHKALHDTFAQFGKILSCKIATNANGESKGYGFVHFDDEESAQKAIQSVDNKKLRDSVVYVGYFMKRSDRMQQYEKSFTNLYVKNLEPEVDDAELQKMFSKYGETTSCIVMKDVSGKSKQFGFVNFQDGEAARQAVEELHDTETSRVDANGQKIKLYVQRAQRKNERSAILKSRYEELRLQRFQKYQGLNVYIRNFAEDVVDNDLREMFTSFGEIQSAKVMRDSSGISRGFGFVCFAKAESANEAIKSMQGFMYKGKPLYVTHAQSKEVRRLQMEQQLAQRSAQTGGQGPPGMNNMYPNTMMFPGPGVPQGYFQNMPRGVIMGQGRGGERPQGMMYNRGPVSGNMYQNDQRNRGRMMRRGGYQPARGPGGNKRGGYGGYGYGGQGGYNGPYPGGAQQRAPGQGDFRRGMGPRGRARDGARDGIQYEQPGQKFPDAPSGGADEQDSGRVNNKNAIGETLYNKIHLSQPSLAGKITGMLLEMGENEVQLLLESDEHLDSKVTEAIQVLKESGVDLGQ